VAKSCIHPQQTIDGIPAGLTSGDLSASDSGVNNGLGTGL
jgi:hypothetical protein